MCTVIIEVPAQPGAGIRVCAVRDENPDRAWDPLGSWWPDTFPGVRGVRDRVAGGAWLATDDANGQLAVILNRAEPTADALPANSQPRASRGTVVLEAVSRSGSPTHPDTAPFNLVTVDGSNALVTSWDGTAVRTQPLPAGVHMIAHHDVNDPRTPRIAAWLPRFQQLAEAPDESWRTAWLALLDETTMLAPTDDRAIVRDNRPHGYPTLSLLVCLAEVSEQQFLVSAHALADPGVWHPAAAHKQLRN